jgi:hypothetical protein
MPQIRLTYWWNGHEPGDVVEVDEVTARTLLSVIAEPVGDDEPAEAEKKAPSRKRTDKPGD